MKQNTKDWIQYTSAVFLILAAVGLAFLAYLVGHSIGYGELAAILQFLSAALGIYGIAGFVRRAQQDIEDIKNQLKK